MKIIDFFKSIHFKLILIFVLLIFVAMQFITVFFTSALEDTLVENFNDTLAEQTDLLEYNVQEELTQSRGEDDNTVQEDIDSLLSQFANSGANNDPGHSSPEARVIGSNQIILGTSNINEQDIVNNQSNDELVQRALLGNTLEEVRWDAESGHRVSLIVRPIEEDGEILGVLYVRSDMSSVYSLVNDISSILIAASIIVLILNAILGILLARTITRPIADMQRQAKIMGEGDFSRRVRVYGNDEIGQLAHSFNQLTLKLKESQASTEDERKKLSSVLTHMTDGVIATDELGRIILMNKRAEQLLNKNSDEMEGTYITEALHLSETLTSSDLYDYNEAIMLDFSSEEQDFLLQANFSIVRNEDGPVTGLITVLHDVTEQEKIERERREFVSNVSHELRTPLTTLKSYMEALEDGAMQDENLGPRFLQVTQNETDRMIRLVNDLLQLSRMDSDEISLEFFTVDLSEMINQVIERFEMINKDKNIAFYKEVPSYPVYVDMDKDRIYQVFDNVLSNAVKYSPDGGEISVQMFTRADAVDVEISDQGVGIPKESQHRIFDRFYRVDKARARNLGGTGLGLAIAKEFIHAHGGRIAADSEWKKGTTILITLPYSVINKAEAGS